MDHFAAMQRLHEKEEREREAKKLERYAAEVAKNPPKVDYQTSLLCLAAANAASKIPGCEFNAKKLKIKHSAAINNHFVKICQDIALKERAALIAARIAEDPDYEDSEGED